MSQCKVLPCSCTHEYQDRRYGRAMRVHNPDVKQENYTCTVCGASKKVAAEKPATKK